MVFTVIISFRVFIFIFFSSSFWLIEIFCLQLFSSLNSSPLCFFALSYDVFFFFFGFPVVLELSKFYLAGRDFCALVILLNSSLHSA